MGEMFNLQSIIVILIVTSFSMIYLQGNSIEKLIVSLILYIMLAFVNIMVIQVISVLSKSPMEVLISGNDILRILVLCISKVTVILTFVIVERGFSKKHYFKKEEYIFGAVLYLSLIHISIAAALLNFLIFYLSTRNYQRVSPKEVHRKYVFKTQMRDAEMRHSGGVTKHKCAVCGLSLIHI